MSLPAPNYTQAPNLFFDEIFKNLTEGELRVVLVLVRQTFGWHKQYDRISLSQMAEKTGMARTSICRSLNSLLAKGIVQKKKIGDPGKERCFYTLSVEAIQQEPLDPDDGIESEEEMALFSNNFDQSPKETPPVSLRDPPSLPKRLDQSPKETHKRNYSKENIQKLSVTSAVAPVGETPPKEEDVPESITITGTGNKKITISKSELFLRIVQAKANWPTQVIFSAWKALGQYNGIVHDWWRFIEGTIQNLLKKQKSENITKESKNQLQEKSSKPRADYSSVRSLGEIFYPKKQGTA